MCTPVSKTIILAKNSGQKDQATIDSQIENPTIESIRSGSSIFCDLTQFGGIHYSSDNTKEGSNNKIECFVSTKGAFIFKNKKTDWKDLKCSAKKDQFNELEKNAYELNGQILV